MPKTISATEANRRFSELLRLIDEGETFIVTTHGRPRVRMERVRKDAHEQSAANGQPRDRRRHQESQDVSLVARDRRYEDAEVLEREHLEFLNYLRTLPLRTVGPWSRDELYDDTQESAE